MRVAGNTVTPGMIEAPFAAPLRADLEIRASIEGMAVQKRSRDIAEAIARTLLWQGSFCDGTALVTGSSVVMH